MKSLNKNVAMVIVGKKTFEIDRLLDTKGLGEKGGYIYHVFLMDGHNKTGTNIGGDFVSKHEAMDWIKENYSLSPQAVSHARERGNEVYESQTN